MRRARSSCVPVSVPLCSQLSNVVGIKMSADSAVNSEMNISNSDLYLERAEVSPNHPALAGHFPDNPIVPGVLILAHVQDAVTRATGARVAEVLTAKFHSFLRPSESFSIQVRTNPRDIVFFRVDSGMRLVARGKLRLDAGAHDLPAMCESSSRRFPP
jgi:3-hydroxymyristoyl/3-hydroxydecanoyl-(acyl carrier protein) dehydratase